MKTLTATAQNLWAALADGRRHHVRDLASDTGLEISQLNAYWKQLPGAVQPMLRQHDGWWQLKHAMVMLSEREASAISAASGFQLEVLPYTTSSNDVLWQRWQQGAEIHRQVVVALEQSQGRGRLQRTWLNQLGQTLMFSIGWCIQQPRADIAALPLVVGWCIQQALRQQALPVQLKWPNDLVVGSLKLGGVLVESKQRGACWHVVMGIGINVVMPEQAPLQHFATACCQYQNEFSSTEFLTALLAQLSEHLPQFSSQGFNVLQDAYQQQMRDLGQAVSLYERGALLGQGTVLGVNELGALRVDEGSGQERVYLNGEISLRANEGASRAPESTQSARNTEPESSASAPISMPKHATTITPALPQTTPMPTAIQSARYIVLDGGNSQLKWAWVDQSRQLHFGGRAPYANLQAFADFMTTLAEHIPLLGCAVCGSKKIAAVEEAAGRAIRWLTSMRQALGVTNHYYKVQQHGSDRWFNVLGSRIFTQNSCVVVSCGTAITIDAITHDQHYLGGSIMPGFNLMKEAMAAKTANLNQPIGKPYPYATSTSNALASGMHDAASGAVVLMHHRLQQRQPDRPVDIVLTGGGAAKVEQHLPRELILDSQVKIVDNLVLFGLQNWVDNACNY